MDVGPVPFRGPGIFWRAVFGGEFREVVIEGFGAEALGSLGFSSMCKIMEIEDWEIYKAGSIFILDDFNGVRGHDGSCR